MEDSVAKNCDCVVSEHASRADRQKEEEVPLLVSAKRELHVICCLLIHFLVLQSGWKIRFAGG
jgi:hypothetical protein